MCKVLLRVGKVREYSVRGKYQNSKLKIRYKIFKASSWESFRVHQILTKCGFISVLIQSVQFYVRKIIYETCWRDFTEQVFVFWVSTSLQTIPENQAIDFHCPIWKRFPRVWLNTQPDCSITKREWRKRPYTHKMSYGYNPGVYRSLFFFFSNTKNYGIIFVRVVQKIRHILPFSLPFPLVCVIESGSFHLSNEVGH